MKRFTVLLIIASALIPACSGDNVTGRKLDEAEALLDTDAERAYRILTEINDTGPGTRAQTARHALLLSIALNKNSKDDGSRIGYLEEASEYYDHHTSGKSKYRMLAHYYLGDRFNDSGEHLPEAIVHLKIALNLAERQENWFYCGMASRKIADICIREHNFLRGLKYSKISHQYFCAAGDKEQIDYAVIELMTAYYNSFKYQDAIELAHTYLSGSTPP